MKFFWIFIHLSFGTFQVSPGYFVNQVHKPKKRIQNGQALKTPKLRGFPPPHPSAGFGARQLRFHCERAF